MKINPDGPISIQKENEVKKKKLNRGQMLRLGTEFYNLFV